MRPTPDTLNGLVNKMFTLDKDPKLVPRPPTDEDAVHNLGTKVTLTVDADGNAALTGSEGDDSGLWVPYATQRYTVGYAARGTTWAASGPFSGL